MGTDSALGSQAQAILTEALTWSISDRLALIERILGSLDKNDPAVDREWLNESEWRLAAHRAGKLAAVDVEEVFEELRSPAEQQRRNNVRRSMQNVNELQDQILKLSPEEYAALRNWFWEQDSITWDAQIEADSKSGKLDRLME